MQYQPAIKLLLVLMTSIALSACNNGGSTTSSNATLTQTDQLQQYMSLLSFTPAGSNQVTTDGTNQQSFTITQNGIITINSIDIHFYNRANCAGMTIIDSVTLNGNPETPVTPAAGTYTSTNASNFALCTIYANGTSNVGCSGLWDSMDLGYVSSIKIVYNLSAYSETYTNSLCLYNSAAKVYPNWEDTGTEGIANWTTQTNSSTCTSESAACGFSQPYNIILGIPG